MIFYYGDAMSTDSNDDIKAYYQAWPLLDIVDAPNKSTHTHIHIYILLGWNVQKSIIKFKNLKNTWSYHAN